MKSDCGTRYSLKRLCKQLIFLYQYGKNGGSKNSQKTCHGYGKTAHGAFDFAHLHSFCRADGMGSCPDRKPSGNRVMDPEESSDKFRRNISEDPCDDNDGDGYGLDTAQLF